MPNSTLDREIESVLLFRNEPVTASELQKLLGASKSEVEKALKSLQEFYKDRGIVLVSDGEEYAFGTHPANADLVEKLRKDEFSRELGRAGLETLAVVLYKGPVSRREIDRIRGVNSGFILRSLLIRGLVERTESAAGERSFTYKPTLALFRHLGVRSPSELPEFAELRVPLEEFANQEQHGE